MSEPCKEVVLTEEDRRILDSYATLVEGLADYLGPSYEVVLHSLEHMDRSVIRIINGHHTGRQPGAPITDLALAMLSRIEEENRDGYISYFSRNKKGEPLKAATITIRGTGGRVIGLLCINFYLNTPLSELLATFSPEPDPGPEAGVSETFAENTQELVRQAVLKAQEQVRADGRVSASNRNREIVARLWKGHIFQIKDAVQIVARELDISPNTVYMHLRRMREPPAL